MKLTYEHKIKRAESIINVIIPNIISNTEPSPERSELLKKWRLLAQWYVMDVKKVNDVKRLPRKSKKKLRK